MAQSPENKPTPGPEAATQAEAERRTAAVGQARDAERTAASAAQSSTRPAAEATRQATQQGGEMMRQGAAAASEGMQFAAEAGSEIARRNARALADTQNRIMQDIAERYDAIGRRMAQSLQDTTSDLRFVLTPPAGVTDNLREIQQSIAGLMTGVVESNLRATREFLRLTDPVSVFDMQRRFAREYLDTVLQGTRAIIRVARQTADHAARPLESQIEARLERHQHRRRNGEEIGIVSDVMTPDVRVVAPDDTVQQATRMMREEDTGVLPVGEGDRLVGVVTDRDVTLRLVAEGKDPARTKVRDVMSQDLKYVFEDEDLAHVADNMAEQQVRRLPVVNRNKRLVGVVSLGDLARASRSGHLAGKAMRGIAAE
ncbi:MAG TPA: CBS domain-containing protein [Rhodopila sp.]|nr:CBS domain-containing protein [Rhodopila sp.]